MVCETDDPGSGKGFSSRLRRWRWAVLLGGGVVVAIVAAFAGWALRNTLGARPAAEVPPAAVAAVATAEVPVAPSTGRVSVRVKPAGAVVRIGGIAYGPAPQTFDALPVGRYRAVITHPGYFDWQGEVGVEEGRDAVVAVELLKSYGSFAVTSDPPDLLFELVGDAGSQTGKADGKVIRVQTGQYELVVRRARHRAVRRKVEVRYDATTMERVSMRGGRVEIESAPAGATVLERGVVLGQTPFAVDGVPGGDHRYELKLKDYVGAECAVLVEEGGCARRSVTLAGFAGPPERTPWRVPGMDLDLVWLGEALVKVGSPGAVNADTMEVSLTAGFWLGATEVTQRQWQRLMRSNPSRVKGDDLPVDQVAWTEAMEFCRQLSAKEAEAGRLPEGYEYSLPSEVQWEYACRAGMRRIDASELDTYAWYRANSSGKPHPVRMKKANGWGLYDMLGNVAELCRDAYRESRPKKATDYLAASGPQDDRRTYRGGHCDEYELAVNAYSRQPLESRLRLANVGFRLALVRKVEPQPNPKR